MTGKLTLRIQKTAHSFGTKGLVPYSIPVYARISPLVTMSMALDIHEVTRQPWTTADVCSILAVNSGLTSSLLYVSNFSMPWVHRL